MGSLKILTEEVDELTESVSQNGVAWAGVAQSVDRASLALQSVPISSGAIRQDPNQPFGTTASLTTSTRAIQDAITTSTRTITDAIATASGSGSGGGVTAGGRGDLYLRALNDILARQSEILARMTSQFSNFANEFYGRR